MRVLVGLHHLELGGSQLTALDLALRVRQIGHDVAIFGVYDDQPGPVAEIAQEAGLQVTLMRHPLERTRRGMPHRPSVARALAKAAVAHRADLVHVYEYPLLLDAFQGPHRRLGIPIVGTIYAMTVPTWVPRYPMLIVGTRGLVVDTAAFRNQPTLIEPPVNTEDDDTAVVDGVAFRQEHGIAADELTLVVVSRLEPDMKAEGIARTIAAVELLGRPYRVRLVIVGTGPSEADLRVRADATNATLGRGAVVMTGALRDPRPAYAAADIALGMGNSAVRAMSFGKPLIVLGVSGFSRPYTPETSESFMRSGFFGCGGGDLNPAPLAAQIRLLADSCLRRRELGRWSREVVLEQYSLSGATNVLLEVYEMAVTERAGASKRRREAFRIAAHKFAADLSPQVVKDRLRRVL